MRGRHRGETRGDRQAMLFNTIDPYVTPGRGLFFKSMRGDIAAVDGIFVVFVLKIMTDNYIRLI